MSYHLRRGQLAEYHAKEFFLARGFRVLAERFKVAGVEVDLILSDHQYIYVTEVKTSTNSNFYAGRVKPQQLERLKRTMVWLSQQDSCQVRLMYAFVRGEHEVKVFFPLEV